MKKQIKLIAAVVIIALVICLLIWRFWPRSFSDLMPADEASISSFSSLARINHFENGQPQTDTYRIDTHQPQDDGIGNVLEILSTFNYQPDLRNLLPWGIDSVSADKNYDGSTITVNFHFHNAENEYMEIQFLSNSIAIVTTEEHPGFRIYHPVNPKIFYNLMEYLKEHGIKQTS